MFQVNEASLNKVHSSLNRAKDSRCRFCLTIFIHRFLSVVQTVPSPFLRYFVRLLKNSDRTYCMSPSKNSPSPGSYSFYNIKNGQKSTLRWDIIAIVIVCDRRTGYADLYQLLFSRISLFECHRAVMEILHRE